MGKQIPKLNKKIVFGAAIIAIAVVVVGFVGYYFHRLDQQQTSDTFESFYADEASEAAKLPVPADKQEALMHYNSVGNSYYSAGNKQKALEYYLKAQVLVEELKPAEGYNYYRAIAELYRDLNEADKAREYYDKEIRYTQSLNDPANEQYLTELRKERDRL